MLRRVFHISTITLFCLLCFACTQSYNNNQENQPFDTKEAVDYTPNISSRDILSNDDVSSIYFKDTVYINLTDKSFSSDNSTYTEITAAKKSKAHTLIEGVIIYQTDNVITLNSESYTDNLKIYITGTLENGSFAMKTSASETALVLHDAKITSSNFPPVEIKGDVTKTYIILEGSNTLNDGRVYGTGYSESNGTEYYTSSFDGTPESDAELTAKWAYGADTKGSFYTKGAFIFSGTGSLQVNEKYKHGIYAKDYIKIESGTITVNSEGRNGIQSINGFIMNDGKVTVSGTGEYTNNESRGIIVEGSEKNPGEGFIEIHGGTINIQTVSKGISAKWDIEDDAESSSIEDDPYPYVKISGGTVSVKTTGTPRDESRTAYSFTDANGVTVTETTKLSPEGIEGKQALFIEGGEILLNTTDDCLNSSRDGSAKVLISGGRIYAYSSNNDAIDSNGILTITGGTIVALTSTTPECAFDCDNYTLSITGGTLIGIGTSNYSAPTSSACTQSTLVLSGEYFGTGGTTFAVTDSDGKAAFAFSIPSTIFGTSAKSDYVMILSSPELKTGTSYNVIKNASASNGENFYGLYTTLPNISGGTTSISGVSTSESNYVYTKSSVSNGGPKEGMHINDGPKPQKP